MAIEIERKYLLINEDWRQLVSKSTRMTQGYLCRSEIKAIRVRVAANQAHINIKQSIDGIHRHEFEYDIPVKDAEEMLKQTAEDGVIDKTRHLIVDGDLTWKLLCYSSSIPNCLESWRVGTVYRLSSHQHTQGLDDCEVALWLQLSHHESSKVPARCPHRE